MNKFLSLVTKFSKDRIYCDGKGSIFNFLNMGGHESRLLVFVIILSILFWILKMLILVDILWTVTFLQNRGNI